MQQKNLQIYGIDRVATFVHYISQISGFCLTAPLVTQKHDISDYTHVLDNEEANDSIKKSACQMFAEFSKCFSE